MNTVEVIIRGPRCLSANLGGKETEILISTLLRERFDYTQWRQSFVDGIKAFDDLETLSGRQTEAPPLKDRRMWFCNFLSLYSNRGRDIPSSHFYIAPAHSECRFAR